MPEYEAPGWTGRMHYKHECDPPVRVDHRDPMWEALGMNAYQQGQCLSLEYHCGCGRTYRCVSAESSFLPMVALIWEAVGGGIIQHKKYVDAENEGRYG